MSRERWGNERLTNRRERKGYNSGIEMRQKGHLIPVTGREEVKSVFRGYEVGTIMGS